MVFCSLLEYAAVGYINKRMKLQAQKKEDKTATALPSPVDRPTARALSVPAYFNRGYRPFYSSTDTNSNLYIPEGQRAPLTLQELDCQCPMVSVEDQRLSIVYTFQQQSPLGQLIFGGVESGTSMPNVEIVTATVQHRQVFILFNVGYWSYFLRISHNDAVLNTDF
ncbi:unnamed protein product [Nippostrongylus brasiliensis]|uniref:Dirigent protein n=1 Tax=Nippostrongylus brasiliensis TaxID=27835 RepID=A0A0N4XI88_NIPBR|nr:unnamed protein product [Nippostrongylus brasiliensis]